MGRPNKIDQAGIGTRVLTLGSTMGSREIAKILEGEGHKVGHVAVFRYLQDHLQERAEATEHVKAAVQAELQKEALSDVQMLEQLRNEIHKVVFLEKPQAIGMYGPIFTEDADGKKIPVMDVPLWLKATKELRDTLTTRIKIAGAGDSDKPGEFTVKFVSADG